MPLLKRKPFTPKKPPPDLKPEEEVFVCRHTNEVFRDYGSFFERTILCNSLLWSCKFTGKSGLTYQEAHESEKVILKQAKSLPEPIQRAVVTLAHYTHRGRLANLCDEVFSYLKDRYQEGEEVEIHYTSKRKIGVITRVISPEESTSSSHLVSPKPRKHSQSDDAFHSPTSTKQRDSSFEKTPSNARKHSSSSDDMPLSAKANKQNAGKSPSPKTPKKSVDEESPSKTKPRKHSSGESLDGKATPNKKRKHSPSDGKDTPSKKTDGGKGAKKVSSSSRKSSEEKLVSPKKKSPSDNSKLQSPKSKKSQSTSERKSVESDVIVIQDCDGDNGGSTPSSKLSSPNTKTVCIWPDASLYKYEVMIHSEKGERGSKKKERHHEIVIVPASIVSRKKGVFTRDKLKMLLKISCERSAPKPTNGFYIVKEVYRHRYELGDPNIPLKLRSPPSDKKGRKRSLSHGTYEEENGQVKKKRKSKEQQTMNDGERKQKKKEKKEKDGKNDKNRKLTSQERKRIMEEEREKRKRDMEEEKERRKVEKERERAENKAKKEEEKAVRKLEREKERERLKEEKRLEAIRLKEWSKPREDLQLDDLVELPKASPVIMKLSSELFGDMMMVLEFLNVFGGLFDIKDEFPSGLTFTMLEEALTEHDAEGVYYDILLFLLGAILRTHLEEEEEEGLDGSHDHEAPIDDDPDAKGATVSASAIMAAAWPMQYQGKPLHELIMDPFTSSELLRLHLLSSGARIGCGESSYRWQRRGGFTYNDDAGVEFRHAEPQLLKALVTSNVYDMAAESKLKIIVALCTQLMTYATARDYVEEGFEQCRKVRREWQEDQWADQRKEKEEAATRYRRRQEERQRQKEEVERRKKEKEQKKVDAAQGTISQNPEDAALKESDQNTADAKKGGKENGTVQDDDLEVRPNSDGQVNDSKTPDEKKGEMNQLLVLTKEEEEELAQLRRDERRRKDQEFADMLTKVWSRSALQPLGRDRVFRRYWSFKSLRGLFVEDDDCEQHLLLGPDPETEQKDDEVHVEGTLEKSDDFEHDKGTPENPIDLTDNAEQVKPLVNGHTCTRTNIKNRASFEMEKANMFKVYNLKADDSNKENICDVYQNRQVVKWSYFTSKEELDLLLDALNPRGFREKPLKEAIQQDYRRLATAVEKCPLKDEVRAQKRESKTRGRRGGKNQQTVDKSRYNTMEEFLEANLRDQILDLEERIWQGSLGVVKVAEREAWRSKVENGIYSQFNEAVKEATDMEPGIVNGVKENGNAKLTDVDDSVGDDREMNTENKLASKEMKEEKQMDIEIHRTPAVNGSLHDENLDHHRVSEELTALEVKKENDPSFSAVPPYLKLDSGPNSPASDTRTSTPIMGLMVDHVMANPAVKELALELLKVQQGIERKFLNPPLGEDEETKRQKQREAAAAAVSEFNDMMRMAEVKEKQKKERKRKEPAEENESKDTAAGSKEAKDEKDDEEGDKKSEDSTSTAEEPTKQKTRLERWEESLLACTSLSQVFVHLNTLDQSIAWSKSVLNARCRLCRRKGDAEHMLLCDACDRGHHMYCLKPPIKEVPEGQWFCADCRPKETRRSERRKKLVLRQEDKEDRQESEEEGASGDGIEQSSDNDEEELESESESDVDGERTRNSSDSSEHGDQCALCTEGGELLCCDTCPLAYHVACAYPPLRRIPRGNWACQVCTGAEEEQPRSCRVKKSTIEAAQKHIERTIKVVKKKPTRASSQAVSRQEKRAPSRLRKRKVSSSPSPSPSLSPPPRGSKATAKSDKKSKRQQVSSSSSRSPSPVSRPARRSSTKRTARGRGRSSIDSSRSSSPVVRSESSKQSSKRDSKLGPKLVLCQKLLDKLIQHDDAWPFAEPVDVTENPDYVEYVKEPMDLGTIKKNLSDKAYKSVEDFAADVRQVFINCSEYCRPRAKEARAGVRLSAFFETQYSDMGLDSTEIRATRSRRI